MERLLDSPNVEAQMGNVRLDCNWCCEQQIPRGHTSVAIGLVFTVLLTATGCSVRKFAINKLGDSLENSGSTFASDNDPEFVGQAIPFSLKLIEALLVALLESHASIVPHVCVFKTLRPHFGVSSLA